MLSVAKLSPGQEGYYERSVARGLDDYYAGRGESPGSWAGTGATGLGLEGVVADGELSQIINGFDPASGERLRRHPRCREIRVERIDPQAGTSTIETKRLAPVAGYDLVFSAPKSVSLLHALGDEPVRRAVNEAHTRAWQAALQYLEDEACVIRRGKGGHIREHAGGFVAAAYQHRTSRAQDPQLHTHVIVANMARSPTDGQYRALDGEAILKTYRLAAGYLYQAQLRHELTRSLGVGWREPVKGMAEIQGVPSQVLREFSRRRLQVVDQLEQTGRVGWRSAQLAAVTTRERKEPVDLPQLREEWLARAAEHRFTTCELHAVLDSSPARDYAEQELNEVSARLVGPYGITERQTTFTEPELIQAWANTLTQGADAQQIRQLTTQTLSNTAVQRVARSGGQACPGRYSTRELIDAERRALDVLERGKSANAPTVSKEALSEAIRARCNPIALSAEQRRMVEHATLTPDRIVCAVGHAGAGKTAATRTIRDAFQRAGVPVIGAAPSGAAAERLQDDTGIASQTLHRLLHATARDGGLPRDCVLVVDEAGMAETRVLAPLLEQIERADGKAILVGDPAQLPAVGAGGLLATVAERAGAVELVQNRRQHEPEERAALRAIRNGCGRDYLAHAENDGRLTVHDNTGALRARLLADWWKHARANSTDNIMIALRRIDVNELNTLARLLMDADGQLGPDHLQVAGREYATGDRVVCRRNSHNLNVRNGTRATITQVDVQMETIKILTDRGDIHHPQPALHRRRARPTRLRTHRPPSPRCHSRASVPSSRKPRTTPGMGLRRRQPRTPGNTPSTSLAPPSSRTRTLRSSTSPNHSPTSPAQSSRRAASDPRSTTNTQSTRGAPHGFRSRAARLAEHR